MNNNIKKSNSKYYLLSTLTLSIVPYFSYAQESTTTEEVEKIVVTSSKKSTLLTNMDGFVELVSAEQIEQANIKSIEQLGSIVPGLTFHQRSSSLFNNITLRGQSSPDFYETKVQVYIDGFAQDQATFGQNLPNELTHVEVLYGPQSSLYGRSAIGGVVNIVTAKPSDTGNLIKASVALGDMKKDISVMAAGALTDNGVYADFSAGYQDKDGIYKELSTDERIGDSYNNFGQLRVQYAPSDSPLDLLFTARRTKVVSDEEQYVPVDQLSAATAFPVENHYELIFESYTTTASYDFDSVIFTSLSSYQTREHDRIVFSTQFPEEQKTFSQEFRLASSNNDSSSFSYVVGAYYDTVDFKYELPAFTLISSQTSESYALFGDVTWNITDKLDITSGLRLDWNNVDAYSAYTSNDISQSSDDNFFAASPKLSVGYQLTPLTRLYALYSTGFKAGGFSNAASPDVVVFSYEPEKVKNIEVGMNTSIIKEKLDFSVATYFTKNDNYQLFIGDIPFQYLQNIGDAETQGVDLTLKAYPTENLSSTLSVTFNDAEFTNYDNPHTPDLDYTGNTLPFVPGTTAHFLVKYDADMPEGYGTLTPSLSANYKSKTYFDEENSFQQRGYTLINASLVWKISDALSINANIDNLSDKQYTVYGFDSGIDLYQLGRGREYSLRVNVEF